LRIIRRGCSTLDCRNKVASLLARCTNRVRNLRKDKDRYVVGDEKIGRLADFWCSAEDEIVEGEPNNKPDFRATF